MQQTHTHTKKHCQNGSNHFFFFNNTEEEPLKKVVSHIINPVPSTESMLNKYLSSERSLILDMLQKENLA